MYVELKSKDLMPLICSLRKYKLHSSRNEEKNKWIQKEFVKGICSRKTFYSIEKGLILAKEKTVDSFLEKLNEEFIYVPELDSIITECSTQIVQNIDFFYIDKAEKYMTKMLTLLKPYDKYLYYKELLFIVKTVYNYYIKSEFMTDKEYMYFKHIYFVFNEDIEELGKDIIFKYLHTVIKSKERYYHQVIQLELDKCKSTANKINQLLFNSFFNDNKLLLETFNDIEVEFMQKKNYIRCIDLYALYLNALMLFSYESIKDEFQLIMERANELIKKVKNEIKIAQFYLNFGLILIRLDLYVESKNHLLQCIRIKSIYQKYAFILYYYCTQKTNTVKDENWDEIISNIDEDIHYSDKMDTAFCFFKKLMNEEAKTDLQQYLIHNVLKYIKKDDRTFIKIFQYELMLLIQETRKYVDLHKFCAHINEV